MTKFFLRGMLHTYPPLVKHAQPWDLPLVLRALTRTLFEPVSSCGIKLLSWKTLFLVAITSVRRVNELAALDT